MNNKSHWLLFPVNILDYNFIYSVHACTDNYPTEVNFFSDKKQMLCFQSGGLAQYRTDVDGGGLKGGTSDGSPIFYAKQAKCYFCKSKIPNHVLLQISIMLSGT